MLTASGLRRRLLSARWASRCIIKHLQTKPYGSAPWENAGEGRRRAARTDAGNGNKANGKRDGLREPGKPSLAEQLFPEETKRYEEAKHQPSREVPRLPLERTEYVEEEQHRVFEKTPPPVSSPWVRPLPGRAMDVGGEQTSVLVLRNASRNLVEEDFRRLIPQGRHMQGWTLEQGDILKIIPGRDTATLEQQNFYYLIFSSQMSAFTYQGHATRVFQLAAAHTPSSVLSPVQTPPGYMVNGVDVHAAIQSFALVPASQTMELRQLKPPLSPVMESIIQDQGYAGIVHRPSKMPFELRLTFDGPQLRAGIIRSILHACGIARGLAWSGGDNMNPTITKWEPVESPSAMDLHSSRTLDFRGRWSETADMSPDFERLEDGGDNTGLKRRTPLVVYILGFHTEHAMQTFLRFWHMRPMAWKGVDVATQYDEEDELPPITRLEILW